LNSAAIKDLRSRKSRQRDCSAEARVNLKHFLKKCLTYFSPWLLDKGAKLILDISYELEVE